MNRIEKLANDLRALSKVGLDYPVTFQGRFGGDVLPQAAELLNLMPGMIAALQGLMDYAENATLDSDELPQELEVAENIIAKALGAQND